MNDRSVGQRTAVVTGATSGLGRAAAAELAARPGWTVVVAARDAARGARAAAEIEAEAGSRGAKGSAGAAGAGGAGAGGPGAGGAGAGTAGAGTAGAGTAGAGTAGAGAAGAPRVLTLPLDLADLASVRAFPDALAAAGLPPLHALVANAGIQHRDRRQTTADGFEATFGVNHLAHALLVRLLLPQLADDGRVIVVASGTHKPQRLRNLGFPPPRWEEPAVLATPGPGSGQVAYATSKLANVLFALELARRVDELRPGARIAVHAFDPGLMPATGLARDYPAPAAALYRALAPRLLRAVPGVTTPAASGAQLARMAADAEHAREPNGRYVELTRDGEPSAQARDAATAARLWAETERLVGLASG